MHSNVDMNPHDQPWGNNSSFAFEWWNTSEMLQRELFLFQIVQNMLNSWPTPFDLLIVKQQNSQYCSLDKWNIIAQCYAVILLNWIINSTKMLEWSDLFIFRYLQHNWFSLLRGSVSSFVQLKTTSTAFDTPFLKGNLYPDFTTRLLH